MLLSLFFNHIYHILTYLDHMTI